MHPVILTAATNKKSMSDMTEQLKHAYLILAHHNFGQLKKLLTLLDDERNDIYIHIDRKAHISKKELDDLSRAVTKAGLEWTRRIRVNWGGYSLVKAEYVLLSAATETPHLYYHLISGADLPIKSQDAIHSFFQSIPKMNSLISTEMSQQIIG